MRVPSIVTKEHQKRLAIGYGRWSTQVEVNRGDDQRAQLGYLYEWGWSKDQVQWLEDSGRSGTGYRPAYLELQSLVQQGRVGVVSVSDLTRLGRSASEVLGFLANCTVHNVLLAVNGQVFDPTDQGKGAPMMALRG